MSELRSVANGMVDEPEEATMRSSEPFLSLCIATLGRADALESLRQGLSELCTKVPWELILVINGRNQLETVIDWQGLSCTVKLLHEPLPGKSRALNLALQVACGEIIVFTDDDIVPSRDWLEHIARAALENPDVAVFGGRILPNGDVPSWVTRSSNLHTGMLSQHDFGEVDLHYPPGAYPIGPNMAVRRIAIQRRRACWNTALGPGTGLPVGDESDFLAQVSPPDARDRLYVADAVVFHTVDGRYFPFRRALLRNFQIGLASGQLAIRYPRRLSTPAALADSFSRGRKRIMGLRSFMELSCIAAKAVGVALGALNQRLARRLS